MLCAPVCLLVGIIAVFPYPMPARFLFNWQTAIFTVHCLPLSLQSFVTFQSYHDSVTVARQRKDASQREAPVINLFAVVGLPPFFFDACLLACIALRF